MTITHSFSSGKADGADTTLVRASGWNADHVITSGIDLPNNASPAAPAAGSLIYSSNVGGRQMLASLGPVGEAQEAQPFMGRKCVSTWRPVGEGGTTITSIGISAPTVSAGSATGRAQATTNALTWARRIGYVSASTAGALAAIRAASRNYIMGSVSGQGGFHVVMTFAISDAVITTTGRMFAGLWTSTGAPTDVDVSTLTNIVGVGCDANDTTLQLYASGSVAQARTSLGASFPTNTTNVDIYELALFCPPNGTSIMYSVTRTNTGNVATGTISAAANLPSNTTLLGQYLWRTNGATAAAVGVDLLSMYAETDQ